MKKVFGDTIVGWIGWSALVVVASILEIFDNFYNFIKRGVVNNTVPKEIIRSAASALHWLLHLFCFIFVYAAIGFFLYFYYLFAVPFRVAMHFIIEGKSRFRYKRWGAILRNFYNSSVFFHIKKYYFRKDWGGLIYHSTLPLLYLLITYPVIFTIDHLVNLYEDENLRR